MFISTLKIKGYRNFKDTTIEFNDGINMIIGPNNGGKTNLLRSLRLIFDSHCRYRKLMIDDFHRPVSLEELKSHSPRVEITATLSPSLDPGREQDDDLRLVRMWLTKLDDNYEAKLSYIFELPSQYEEEYIGTVKRFNNENEIWQIIELDFIRRYKYYIIGGEISNKEKADSESLNRFDVQSLEALRNIENDLINSRSTLLKEVIEFYIDYEIKNNTNLTKEERDVEQKKIQDEFKKNSRLIIDHLIKRLQTGKNQIMNYAKNTGASFNNATPDFNGDMSEQDLYSALKIIVKYETGIELPISHNGLGYNNLIYISLLLAKIQADADNKRMGDNSIIFPILIIEEPEAHLHPSMQYKFLSFLKDNQTSKVRQIFVSTHSTQIASAVNLKELICLQRSKNEEISIAYPFRTFPLTEDGQASLRYVQRFLDATRSDMLFADKVIFVEGIAEELLLDTLAKYCNYSLSDHHVCIVNVGGRYFEHFLKLFNTNKSEFALKKRVLCLTDIDPSRKLKGDKTYCSCYPFEMGIDKELYDFAQNPFVRSAKEFSDVENINISYSDEKEGKTFEFDLLFNNPKSKWLINESMKNSEKIKKLMDCKDFAEAKTKFGNSDWKTKVLDSIEKCEWSDDKKHAALIASYYLKSVNKGDNALFTSTLLSENLGNINDKEKFHEFKVPKYIEDGLTWLLK